MKLPGCGAGAGKWPCRQLSVLEVTEKAQRQSTSQKAMAGFCSPLCPRSKPADAGAALVLRLAVLLAFSFDVSSDPTRWSRRQLSSESEMAFFKHQVRDDKAAVACLGLRRHSISRESACAEEPMRRFAASDPGTLRSLWYLSPDRPCCSQSKPPAAAGTLRCPSYTP